MKEKTDKIIDTTAEEIKAIKILGEQIGYGHMMALTSALWRQKLKEDGYSDRGAFIPTIIIFLKEEYREIVGKENKIYDLLIK